MIDNLTILKLHHHQQYLDQCVEILNDCWPRSRTARLHSLNKSNDNYPCNYVMVNTDEQVIGHVSVSLRTDSCTVKTAYIESLIIAKRFRRKGFGRYLMFEVEKILKKDDFKVIALKTIDQVPFYESVGFKLKFEMKSLVSGQIRKRIEQNDQSCNELKDDQINGRTVHKSLNRTDGESISNESMFNMNELSNKLTTKDQNIKINQTTAIDLPLPPPLPINNQSNHVLEYFMEKVL